MKTLLSIVVAVSLMTSVTEKKNELALKKEVKEVSLTSGKIPNTKISYTISTVRRGRYAKIEFTNDYDFPVLLEGIVDGHTIGRPRSYKVKVKPNKRRSFLIRYIRRYSDVDDCSGLDTADQCSDMNRQVLNNYNVYDTGSITVMNLKIKVLEEEKKEKE